jgi:hypothetical protein
MVMNSWKVRQKYSLCYSMHIPLFNFQPTVSFIARKDACWSYYKSQQLYIEALQEAKDDREFDPHRSEHVTGKDGKFEQKRNAS